MALELRNRMVKLYFSYDELIEALLEDDIIIDKNLISVLRGKQDRISYFIKGLCPILQRERSPESTFFFEACVCFYEEKLVFSKLSAAFVSTVINPCTIIYDLLDDDRVRRGD